MKRGFVVTAFAVLVGVGLSCLDRTGPVAGILNVKLTSPNSGADSAIVFTITGPAPLTSATPSAGLRLFAQPLGHHHPLRADGPAFDQHDDLDDRRGRR